MKATDSAGTEFQLGAAEEAIKMLALLNSTERKRLPVRNIIIEAPDGSVIDRLELRRRAQEEVHALALERAGRAHVPGRPPGE
ncbi:MAG TPA: hypothetical protein VEX35_08855 [Allosphingosinicella sp.]|nr:hypothetical protein [Allosphingosinicella sp.]